MEKIAIAIHGGAGTILKSKITAKNEARLIEALDKALTTGFDALKNNKSSLDAVEKAVIEMESN